MSLDLPTPKLSEPQQKVDQTEAEPEDVVVEGSEEGEYSDNPYGYEDEEDEVAEPAEAEQKITLPGFYDLAFRALEIHYEGSVTSRTPISYQGIKGEEGVFSGVFAGRRLYGKVRVLGEEESVVVLMFLGRQPDAAKLEDGLSFFTSLRIE
jgi:hypothetical protein